MSAVFARSTIWEFNISIFWRYNHAIYGDHYLFSGTVTTSPPTYVRYTHVLFHTSWDSNPRPKTVDLILFPLA